MLIAQRGKGTIWRRFWVT